MKFTEAPLKTATIKMLGRQSLFYVSGCKLLNGTDA
jgi:hypothetical protein